MIKYICDKCEKEKDKDDIFIIKRKDELHQILCSNCFKENLNREVEIYRRIIIQKYKQGNDIRLEDYIIVLDLNSIKLPEGYESYKKQLLKKVAFHNSVKAVVILNGWSRFPDESPDYCTSNITIPGLVI